MHESSEARSRYLALALASREVLRSLDGYVKTGESNGQLEVTVGKVINSLNAIRPEMNLFGPIPDESAFTSYEQLMTLDEVMTDVGQDIVNDLTNLFSGPRDETARKQSAAKALAFFYTLENRALHHYSRPVGSREP